MISVPTIMTAMNLSSTDVFRRSHLFGLCVLPANGLSEIFHPSFPSSSMPIGNFYLAFHLFYEGIDYVLGHSFPKNEEDTGY